MRLTVEQRDAVRCDDDVMLTACPGSGKTRVLTSKLSRVIDTIRETPRAAACITYTNAAVHEIESRLRRHIQPGDDICFDVCTIHSFCLNHVFRPFRHLIKGYKLGFKVLTPDSAEFEEYASAACAEFGKHNLTAADLDDFVQLRISTDGEPVGNAIERGSITPEIAKSFWKRIREAGFIDFPGIVYYSFRLLERRREVLSYVSAKFAWILVDEFQDTSDLQVEILSLIASRKRTRFFVVGDPFQSVYRFAGARPDLANQFAALIGARTDFSLSGNFRSSPVIVEHANRLFGRTPVMTAVGEAKNFTDEPEWRHGASPFDVITDYFLPVLEQMQIAVGDAAILAPSWFPLFRLGRHLREYGVNIVGPGARPYRRTRQFASLAEQICGYLMEPRPEAIIGVERTLFNTVLDMTGEANFRIFSYTGRVTVFRLLHKARELHAAHMGAVQWLEAAAISFSTILIEDGYLSRAEECAFATSVEEMKADMGSNGVDLPNLTIDSLGIYASPDAALKLSTLHNAKGREYLAVAMIDLHEGRIPFRQAQSAEDFEEAKRLFYVGVTRAQRFLMYVTDISHPRNEPTRFLRADGIGVC